MNRVKSVLGWLSIFLFLWGLMLYFAAPALTTPEDANIQHILQGLGVVSAIVGVGLGIFLMQRERKRVKSMGSSTKHPLEADTQPTKTVDQPRRRTWYVQAIAVGLQPYTVAHNPRPLLQNRMIVLQRRRAISQENAVFQ